MDGERRTAADEPIGPDYLDACIANVVPALSGEAEYDWMPDEVLDAHRIVLLVLDGIGWNQLCDRMHLAPVLSGLDGGAITSVAPTTTATALTSISTGLAPGVHGIIGYRIAIGRSVLNVLRWNADGRDARRSILPSSIQTHDVFGAQRPPVITRAEFRESGFTEAHLAGTRLSGWRMPSALVTSAVDCADRNEPFTYAYYDGVDKIAHEYGLGRYYDAELAATDALVGMLVERLPRGTALVVTSDHGQVDVGDAVITLAPEVMAHVSMQSGEGRFRWLHARPGHARHLREAAERYSDVAWVRTVDEVIDAGWFGEVTDTSRAMLGDVALLAREAVSFDDPADSGPYALRARHGSLTADEMYVPLLHVVV